MKASSAARVTIVPVGLSGVFTNTMRVRGVTRAAIAARSLR